MTDPDADLLKVAPDASLGDLKKAFRKAALAHHPDQNPDPGAARHFRRLTEAYRNLEARAVLNEPPKPKRTIPWEDRVGFLLGDLGTFVRRWPADRWTVVSDGLPAAVWAASILDVLAQTWPGEPTAEPVVPTPGGIADALEAWAGRLGQNPLPRPVPKDLAQALERALGSAERRVKSLGRAAQDRRRRGPA